MMVDPAFEETERRIKNLEKRIALEYEKAIAGVQKKLDDYLKRFYKKDATWAEWVADGKKTVAQYNEWRTNQLIMGQRWADLRDVLAADYHHANEIARSIINGELPEIYAINHNYGVYEVEHGLGVDTSYTLYNRHTVARILLDDPDLFRPPGKDITPAAATAKDLLWNRNQLQSAMLQSILQGESIPKMAERVARAVGEKDRRIATRNARTMATGAQNAGRLDSYFRAQDMGIKIEKQWIATLDSRTRHSHRELDGESVPLKEEYSNGLMYPGDPDGDPEEIWNCRCCQIASLQGFERDLSDLSLRNTAHFEHMSYAEWKADKKSKSNPILLPRDKANRIRGSYIKQYREG